MNRVYLLVMTNLPVKYEDFVIYGFQNNQQKPSGLPTTDIIARQYTPSSLKGGIIKPSNGLDVLTFELNVTLTLLVMVIICAKPFKKNLVV